MDYCLGKQDSKINWPTVLKVTSCAPFPHGSLVGASPLQWQFVMLSYTLWAAVLQFHTWVPSEVMDECSHSYSLGNICLTCFMYYFLHIYLKLFCLSRVSLDLRPSQVPSAVKTSAEKSLSFSAMALLSPCAPYEPLAPCGTAISLDGSLFSFKQLSTISLVISAKFSHSFLAILVAFYPWSIFMGFPVHFSNFLNDSPFCLLPTIASLGFFFFYELWRVFIEPFYFLFDMWHIVYWDF